jgi:hypothetical protein
MTDIISLAQRREDEKWKLQTMLNWREGTLWSEPITSKQLTCIDAWLAKQPHLELRTAIEILWRTVHVLALAYEDTPYPALRHKMLLEVRRQYRQLERIIPAEAMSAMWTVWCDVLEDEEIREKEQGNGGAA